VVRKWFDGDVSGILHADVLGYFLYNLYGDVTTTTVTGAVKSHLFQLDDTIKHPTLSIFAKDGDVEQATFSGGVLNTLEITATTDDYVRFTANIIAENSASNSDTPSYDVEYDFIGKDVTVKIADTEAGLAGATAIKLKELTLNYDTGAISDFKLGSYNPDVYNSRMAIEGSFEKNYTDKTFQNLHNADTAKYMEIQIQGDAVLAGSNRPTAKFVFNKVQVTNWERAGGNDDLVTETVEFKAFYNFADEEQSKATVINLTANYEIGS
jgi:hypothetical protein